MKIYSGPMSMFGAKVQIAVLEKGLDAETVMVPFGLRRRYEPKDPDVVRISPKGQVPVLIDGRVQLYDSTQIFEYLEDAYPVPPLWPAEAANRAVARQLEHGSDELFFPYIIKLMAPDGDDRSGSLDRAAAYHRAMDGQLGGREFLAGPFTYADIAFFMASFFGEVLGAAIAPKRTVLLAWRRRVAERPAVREVVRPILDYMAARRLVDGDFGQRAFGWNSDAG